MARLAEPPAISADAIEACTPTPTTTSSNTTHFESSPPPRETSNNNITITTTTTTTSSSFSSASRSSEVHDADSCPALASLADRKRLARQNRDLARSNNWRGLRIRELETEQSCMLSENLALHTRILELEGELRNNHARRIADHALAIKAQLENQLLEFGSILEGLGMEPPLKRRSRSSRETRVFANLSGRRSSGFARPSPSQRRLRDVASQVEELGHIPENKTYSRRSLSSEQILALRAQAQAEEEAFESPELGPPPLSRFVDGRLSDSPPKSPSPHNIPNSAPYSPTPLSSPFNPSPVAEMEARPDEPEAGQQEPVKQPPTSPVAQRISSPPSLEPVPAPDLEYNPPASLPTQDSLDEGTLEANSTPSSAAPASLPLKSGTKRKFNAGDDVENQPIHASPAPSKNKKRNNASSRALKEASKARQRVVAALRKPLAAKSTNDDIVNSPIKKSTKAHPLSITASKLDVAAKAQENERPKTKLKRDSIPIFCADPVATPASPVPITVSPVPKRALDPVPDIPATSSLPRDDHAAPGTPSPALMEATRLSRRARAAVSYAEPNLRDKMRRPGKELMDAVVGEAKNRRSSHDATAVSSEQRDTHDETGESAKAGTSSDNGVRVEVPAGPLAEQHVPPPPAAEAEPLPTNATTKQKSKASALATDSTDTADKSRPQSSDTYDMPGSPPSSPGNSTHQPIDDNQEPNERPISRHRGSRRPSAASKATSRKRSSMTASSKGETQHEGEAGERRSETRRRSMMV